MTTMEKRARQRSRYSPDSVETLVSALTSLQARQAKAVLPTIHTYPTPDIGQSLEQHHSENDLPPTPELTKYITSWKMLEHLYRRKDCPFPTLARGLFIASKDYSLQRARDRLTGNSTGVEDDMIIARGYDKFFNVGEIEWTEWDNLERYTSPPYHLTYKSNGCLILISALSPTELVVSSKHSLGTTVAPRESEAPTAVAGNVEIGMTASICSDGQEGPNGLESAAKALQAVHIKPSEETASNEKVHVKSEDQEGINGSSAQILVAGASSGPDPTVHPKGTAPADPNSLSSKKKAEKATKKAEKAKVKAADKQTEADAETANAGLSTASASAPTTEGADESVSHAGMGRSWLTKTLRKAGKTEEELARVLWDRQLSAVAELCDDSFEEHVLATPEHLTGLHLHGLNANTPHFATLPPAEVEDFAKTWGFIPTPSVQLETLGEVKSYTDDIGKEGKWRGEAIEGFVVRSIVKDLEEDEAEDMDFDDQADGAPPYPPGSPFFFKIKFDEPYLMYRQWREITRTLMPLINPKCGGRKNRNTAPWTKMGQKLKRPESALYADWCARMMVSEPEVFNDYDRGVIRVRERFLSWTEAEGKDQWRSARLKSEAKDRAQETGGSVKAIIVPIAVPGTGKTLLGVALSELFGMAHTQSDDVAAKSTAAGFLRNITELLAKNDLVYCDRNNHLPKHHEELVDLAAGLSSDVPIRRIALLFDVDHHPYNRALALTSERVLSRGENHQSLRPDPEDQLRHELVIRQFLNEFVPPEGALFDTVIKLKLLGSLQENLETACAGLSKALRRPMPSMEEIKSALGRALEYKPEVKKDRQGKESAPPRYYGLAMEMNLEHAVLRALKLAGGSGAHRKKLDQARSFLDVLIARSRITSRPHVTIVHEKSVAAEREDDTASAVPADPSGHVGPQQRLWNECAALGKIARPTRFEFDLTALAWDERVMTLVVENVRPAGSGSHITPVKSDDEKEEDKAQTVERALCDDLKDVLHVTVGTRDESIAPFEARGLVQAWRAAKAKVDGRGEEEAGDGSGAQGGEVHWIELKGMSDSGRVMGMH